MPINPDLLVSAAMLQDYLVDKDSGLPLTNGLVSLYKDNARSFYKNWYYQTGVPGAYTWVALDNPMHLSVAGTIQDPNGNDVIPFYYPYEENDENIPEAYYITVYSVDSNGEQSTLQFTRENFPFQPSGASPSSQIPTLDNVIVNNVFWRNIGALDAMATLNSVIAPSQHDGYTNGDIRFIKNVAGANDDLAFLPMTETLDNDITPELYLNMQCSGVQVGETVKCIQYPVSLHIKTLANVDAKLVIQAQNVAGSSNNYLDLYVYQYLGTGALSQPEPILIKRILLNNSFQKFVIPFTFPDDTLLGLVPGIGGDDALFIRVQYPLSSLFNINHTKVSVYLSDVVPDNDFDTYDEIAAITNSDRTGDLKPSYNYSGTFNVTGGYVPMNDGSIGSTASGSSTRANNDTWPLYNVLWNSVVNTYCPLFLAGVPTTRGASAYADFSANKAMALPKQLARVLSGAAPSGVNYIKYFTRSGNTLLVDDTSSFSTGQAVLLSTTGTLPNPLLSATTYYLIIVSATAVSLATTRTNAVDGVVIPLTTAGTGLNEFTGSFGPHPLGSYIGQDDHTQLNTEMNIHTHVLGSSSTILGTQTSGGGGPIAAVVAQYTVPPTSEAILGGSTNSSGGNTPFNIIQPTSYSNFLIKL